MDDLLNKYILVELSRIQIPQYTEKYLVTNWSEKNGPVVLSPNITVSTLWELLSWFSTSASGWMVFCILEIEDNESIGRGLAELEQKRINQEEASLAKEERRRQRRENAALVEIKQEPIVKTEEEPIIKSEGDILEEEIKQEIKQEESMPVISEVSSLLSEFSVEESSNEEASESGLPKVNALMRGGAKETKWKGPAVVPPVSNDKINTKATQRGRGRGSKPQQEAESSRSDHPTRTQKLSQRKKKSLENDVVEKRISKRKRVNSKPDETTAKDIPVRGSTSQDPHQRNFLEVRNIRAATHLYLPRRSDACGIQHIKSLQWLAFRGSRPAKYD